MNRIKAALAVVIFVGVIVGGGILRDLAFRELPATVERAYQLSHGQPR